MKHISFPITFYIHSFCSSYIRRITQVTLQEQASKGLSAQFPAARCIQQGCLTSGGPFHELHANGHDKLGAQALQMGGVELSIYGIKDKFSSLIVLLVVLLNNCLTDTIGHLYFDFIIRNSGKSPSQLIRPFP